MIISKVSNPSFPAPKGIKLADAIQLSQQKLEAHRIYISSLSVQDDLSVEIDFRSYKEIIDDLIDEQYENDDEDGNPIPFDRSDAYETINDGLIDFYMDNLKEIGIPIESIFCGPNKNSDSFGTDYTFSARFLVEPAHSYGIPISLTCVMKRQDRVRRITIPKTLLMLADEVGAQNAFEYQYNYITDLGLQLAWDFAWPLHWAIDYTSVDYEERGGKDPKLVFEYVFFDRGDSSWDIKCDHSRPLPVDVYNLKLRPIIPKKSTGSKKSS